MALSVSELLGLLTVVVTMYVAVTPAASVAVIVDVYVPAPTVFPILKTARLVVDVSIVIPELLGDEDKVRVLFPVPAVAVTVSKTMFPKVVLKVFVVPVRIGV
jgi:hypothetical protein